MKNGLAKIIVVQIVLFLLLFIAISAGDFENQSARMTAFIFMVILVLFILALLINRYLFKLNYTLNIFISNLFALELPSVFAYNSLRLYLINIVLSAILTLIVKAVSNELKAFDD